MGRILMMFLMIAGLEVQSAEFKTVDKTIFMEGSIEKGDERKLFLELDANKEVTKLVIDSSGGIYEESKNMAKLIRVFKLDTEVQSGKKAISGGAIMLFSGKIITVGMTAKVGLHAPYFSDKEEFNDSTKAWLETEKEEPDYFAYNREGAEMIAEYMVTMGELTSVPPSIIIKSAIHVDGSLYHLSIADYGTFKNVYLNKEKEDE